MNHTRETFNGSGIDTLGGATHKSMRIDRLELENFKKYAHQVFELHPQFTLFVGENGSGKTTVLDALAVAAGIWLVEPPDSTLNGSRRNIALTEIRLEPEPVGDRIQFRERRPVKVIAGGVIGELPLFKWTRQIRPTGQRTVNGDAKLALEAVKDMYKRDHARERVLFPLVAYYGAGRAWLPSNKPIPKQHADGSWGSGAFGAGPFGGGPSRRWAAFSDCLNERIRFGELSKWFQKETTERGNRNGKSRPGFEVVCRAILKCVPGSDRVWFDTDREQIVLSIDGQAQPFNNLSAGQRMMLALVADLAIKAVTQNAFLLPPDELPPGQPEVLAKTPGLVLIDELDVHLHPKWQRRVASDLKATFPSIQFVCTSHSPQIIGQLKPEEIRVLDDASATVPPRSFGIDSNRILEEVMDTSSRDDSVGRLLAHLFQLIDEENFDGARVALPVVEALIGADDPEITRARALMAFLES